MPAVRGEGKSALSLLFDQSNKTIGPIEMGVRRNSEMPTRPHSELDAITDWKLLFMRWIVRQNVSTVLLFAMSAAACYAGRHVLTVIIPNHIDQIGVLISTTFKDLEESHRAERKESEERNIASIEKVTKQFIDQQTKDRDLMREMLFNSNKKMSSLSPMAPQPESSPN